MSRFETFLIRAAAWLLPADSRTRYREEWLAEYDAQPPSSSSLAFTLRLLSRSPSVAQALRSDTGLAFAEITLAALAFAPSSILFFLISLRAQNPRLSLGHGLLTVGNIVLGTGLWLDTTGLLKSRHSRLGAALVAGGLITLSAGPHHVPRPGPAEPAIDVALLAMLIGVLLSVIHSIQATPRRAIGQAGLTFVLGACVAVFLADTINTVAVRNDVTTAIGYLLAAIAGLVGAVATYLVGRRAGILESVPNR